ncbi:MAG: DUF1194 domain-containing protein [Rhodoplanes sp.]|uniref:DUF1194 domain-containing protein n=1 Tax=Rhodoplanes sp. TaxID=1968906 RepID=UPI0017909563|nr:DUF1194 domain-containing protein [Rhodoplanes sp.]NVO14418.1 DUF1194 domain-containing protein [Rhodoplanes sp.]
MRRGIRVAAAGMGFGAVLAAAGLGAAPALRFADLPASQAGSTVDVELVLAVDVSYSMDPDEQALQREGYVTALTSPEFLGALRQGMHGKIVATYVEWAGAADQRVVVPWRLIDGPATAEAFATAIAEAPYRRAYRTSISGALQFSSQLFQESGQRGIRRVIDVSGDGANNQGAPVDITRDEVVAKGITINGLPLMLKRPSVATMDIEALDIYYEDCVIGGPSAFMVPIRDRSQFREATRTKLVLEVAGRAPRVIPAAEPDQAAGPGPGAAPPAAPRVSCTVGERLWQQRWGRGSDFN